MTTPKQWLVWADHIVYPLVLLAVPALVPLFLFYIPPRADVAAGIYFLALPLEMYVIFTCVYSTHAIRDHVLHLRSSTLAPNYYTPHHDSIPALIHPFTVPNAHYTGQFPWSFTALCSKDTLNRHAAKTLGNLIHGVTPWRARTDGELQDHDAEQARTMASWAPRVWCSRGACCAPHRREALHEAICCGMVETVRTLLALYPGDAVVPHTMTAWPDPRRRSYEVTGVKQPAYHRAVAVVATKDGPVGFDWRASRSENLRRVAVIGAIKLAYANEGAPLPLAFEVSLPVPSGLSNCRRNVTKDRERRILAGLLL